MADDYGYDFDEDFGLDDGWMYVEDEYGLVDELIETQIAEPGYAGTNYEIDMESYEYDMYEYFDDLEYADDAYWEYDVHHNTSDSANAAGLKRKRVVAAGKLGDKQTAVAHKRRKVEPLQRPAYSGVAPESVLYMSLEKQVEVALRRPPTVKNLTPIAFLPDWKKRYANVDGIMRSADMPTDMQQAADAPPEETSETQGVADAEVGLLGGGAEDVVDEEDDDVAVDGEMLKTILRQRLVESGLDGFDEEAFMTAIQDMLNSEPGEDEGLGRLVEMLLGKPNADEDGGGAILGWLSGQGVRLETGDQEVDRDEEDDEEGVEVPNGAALSANGSSQSDADADAAGSHTRTGNGTAEVEQEPEVERSKRRQMPTPPLSGGGTQMHDGTLQVSLKKVSNTIPENGSVTKRNYFASATSGGSGAVADDGVLIAAVDQATLAARAQPSRSTRKRKKAPEDSEQVNVHVNGLRRLVKEPATRRTRSARAAVAKE
ncbi:hypothetical protein BAUCODRAFT_26462 [Baudoinia panamericana UAMH 10762]|uniref:Uncharacterized protein n=1 Tax=Baudoinia panamericana (strain UAMH 10762) TaxID=717646 RepID=M2N5I1_BAUPA|nr:uncharacterized protein BAUCODRAFT_26462 [Baudoinia panamericana UAMH 10762]EMC94304.1 hypothetical protein BAUCODRAFT_26462 [Baudoinia panamericana UAMH 10762]